MKKKLLSILLSLAMVVTMMPAMTMTSNAIDNWCEQINKTGDLTGLDIKGEPIKYESGGKTIECTITRPMYVDVHLYCKNNEQTGQVKKALNYEVNAGNSGWLDENKPTFSDDGGDDERFLFYVSQELIDAHDGTYMFSASARASKFPNVPIAQLGQVVHLNVTCYEENIEYSNWGLLSMAMKGAEPANTSAELTVSSDGTNLFTVKDAEDGTRTIKLLTDITATSADSALMVLAGKKDVLDLNGYTLDRGLSENIAAVDNGNVINVKYGGTLTINDKSNPSTGKIVGGTATYGGAIVSYGNTILEGGTIKDCKAVSETYDGGVHASRLGRGGAIYVMADNDSQKGSFVMKGGKIENCSASVAGGAIFVVGSMDMLDGEITDCFVSGVEEDNVIKAKGGAVYLYGNSKFSMTSGEITSNTLGNVSDARGAGLYVASGVNVVLGGTAKIYNNKVYGTDTNSNMFLYDDVLVNIATESNAPQIGMNIGVTSKTVLSKEILNCAISTACSDCSAYFFADNSNEEITYDDCVLKLTYDKEEPTPVYKKRAVELAWAKTYGKKAIKLTWTKVPGATRYVVYGAKTGKKYKKIKATTARKYIVKKIKGKKLKAHKTYKFYVVAYKGSKKIVSSKKICFITAKTMGRYANIKSIKAKKTKLTMKVGKTYRVQAIISKYKGKKHISKKHGNALKYTSNCTSVATVNSKGVVTAKNPGTATIYIQDISGKYCKTVVTVNK